jgi:hypothetical protein
MRIRIPGRTVGLVAAVLAAGALGWFGSAVLSPSSAPTHNSDRADSDAYFAGLLAGEAQGRQEGRALQEGTALPKNARHAVSDAFNAGYTAGANDAFAGYDGGWTLSAPYIVTLNEGAGQIVYRIDSRTVVKARVTYQLCADGHDICQERRR